MGILIQVIIKGEFSEEGVWEKPERAGKKYQQGQGLKVETTSAWSCRELWNLHHTMELVPYWDKGTGFLYYNASQLLAVGCPGVDWGVASWARWSSSGGHSLEKDTAVSPKQPTPTGAGEYVPPPGKEVLVRAPIAFCLLFSHQVRSSSSWPQNCSTPGFPVLHHLPESAPVHVPCIGAVIRPPHPQSPSFPSAFKLSQHQGLFQWVDSSHQVASSFHCPLSPAVQVGFAYTYSINNCWWLQGGQALFQAQAMLG